MMQRLDRDIFKTVVASTPLVSIDLIIRNRKGQVLLGKRTNKPAQGYWFVPGGRIVKDELFVDAFLRLTTVELGQAISIDEARFLGPYEHHYADNFSSDYFSTHYVVLGYELSLDIDINTLPSDQHGHYRWLSVDDLLHSDDVHLNTKLYFQAHA